MPEPDVQKIATCHSFFLSFSFPALTEDCHERSSYFEYKSTLFCNTQCSGTLILRYLHSDVIVGVYGALMIGVSDMPFCNIMCMLRMCCHGEVM